MEQIQEDLNISEEHDSEQILDEERIEEAGVDKTEVIEDVPVDGTETKVDELTNLDEREDTTTHIDDDLNVSGESEENKIVKNIEDTEVPFQVNEESHAELILFEKQPDLEPSTKSNFEDENKIAENDPITEQSEKDDSEPRCAQENEHALVNEEPPLGTEEDIQTMATDEQETIEDIKDAPPADDMKMVIEKEIAELENTASTASENPVVLGSSEQSVLNILVPNTSTTLLDVKISEETSSTKEGAPLSVEEAPQYVKEASLPGNEGPQPIKESPLPLKEAPEPVKEPPILIKEIPPSLKEDQLLVKEPLLSVKESTLPAKEALLIVKETPAPIKEAPLPAKEVSLTLPASEPQPSTSSMHQEDEEGFMSTEMEDPAALLGEDTQEAAPEETEPEKNDEPMHMDELPQAPKVLASMPTLMSIPETPTIYSRIEIKKQDSNIPLQTVTLKGSQKILKEILPQSEGQQIIHIPNQTPTIFIQGNPPVLTPIKQLDQAIAQIQKKESSETDDLATLANAALGDQTSVKIIEEPPKKEPVWCDVGIIKGTSCHVMSYYEPTFSHDPEHENITADNLPDYSNSFKVELEPGTAYKFRVCAVNSCGRGPWSEVSAFKTCLPGYPGAPSSIKISKSTEGAHLSWEPPSNPAGNIIEYSVCLAVRNPPQGHGDQKGQQLAFVRVYSGPHNQTVVPNSSLAAAHIDTTSKPAIIFRIAAKNEKGFGPATQVRWLQDVVASPTGGVKPMLKKEPIASAIPMKRPKIDDF